MRHRLTHIFAYIRNGIERRYLVPREPLALAELDDILWYHSSVYCECGEKEGVIP